MLELPIALHALSRYKQFILYKTVPSTTRIGKTDKFPIDHRTMRIADAHDPAIWIEAIDAIQISNLMGPEWGAGFVFTSADPFWFLDIDDCLGTDGWNPISTELCSMFNGCAIEISHSGKGLHIFGSGIVPDHGCKNIGLGLEFYTESRFVALTGTNAIGDAGFDTSHLMPLLIDKYFKPTARGPTVEWRNTPVEDWSGPEDDEELIAKMLASKPSAGSLFNNTATLLDLWMANTDALVKAYPSRNDKDPYDRSSADAALAQHLAWWTGKNHTRIERLMRQSALVRTKWDWHSSYMQTTIENAVNQQVSVAALKIKKNSIFRENPAINTNMSLLLPGVSYTVGIQMLTANQMVDHFRGCVYVRDLHRVYTPDGSLLKSEQFNAIYGGYTFMLDSENDKSTRKAYEAFTECQSIKFPKVSGVCFRPEIPSGAIVDEEGQTLLNTYVPIETTRREGDTKPFLDYLKRLLPDQTDRTKLLCYIASLVQNPGIKFQWCPMLQGAEGNGKTFIISAIAHAVGHRYAHLPKASEIDSKFNGWVTGKLFAGVEEIYTPDRRDILEGIKTLITNSRLPIERKGVDQFTGDNRVNFLISTNHKDGIPITTDTRRYAPFYCAQQTEGDIRRDFPGDYFYNLYEWARNGGWEIINYYLRTYQVADEYNPATLCQRAPRTSSTDEAVMVSLGTVEQEIINAIEEGRTGFNGGWVSGLKLNDLLHELRADRRIPRNKRRELMQRLGYDWHPHLKEGRSNSNVIVEGGKPKLFIKNGHLLRNLSEGSAITKAYMDAQCYPPLGTLNHITQI